MVDLERAISVAESEKDVKAAYDIIMTAAKRKVRSDRKFNKLDDKNLIDYYRNAPIENYWPWENVDTSKLGAW